VSQYPLRFLRGLVANSLNENGRVKAGAVFQFQRRGGRSDGRREMSINWDDAEGARVSLVTAVGGESGELKYPEGAVVIDREEVDRLLVRPESAGCLAYERAKIEGNEYHGNVTVAGDADSDTQQIAKSILQLAIVERLPGARGRASEPA